ncbi:acyl-CoA dehydrogenase family protein [Actinomadura rudentiformis]|uniref:Acyl-CoA dehydrogenase n=1 Tax=Actinomadura rudentiformis TaxID=359158 RepID=A0A6H9YM98_9ACTN|nr:acyl-CoA dehydrogenase family protein [Actinomadura rudentiformis]KAB2341552.1 acyl-CoA dehydrogenase [Actinomadura rudentiformis]
MHLAETEAQATMRARLRAYFAEVMTPELRHRFRNGYYAEDATDAYRSVVRRLGEDGWLGIGWPKEIGGQGLSMVEQAIFSDEAAQADVPLPLLTINSVGPAIAAHGTREQRESLVPGILRGEIHFAIGYSEPEAGTDLASLTTRAVRDGGEYVINGQKLWIGMMEAADYIWLAVRTDPDAPRHRGISVLIVPRNAPGVSSTRLRTLGDHSVAAVGFDDVRVPVENCIGGENNGWAMITGQLNTERVALVSTAPVEQVLAEVRRWAAEARSGDGSPMLDDPAVRQALARVRAEVEFQRLLNAKLATAVDAGRLEPAEASAAKVYGSELFGRGRRLLYEVVGLDAGLDGNSPDAVAGGAFAKGAGSANVMTFIGGANEIQRDLIAQLGLGLPRAPR